MATPKNQSVQKALVSGAGRVGFECRTDPPLGPSVASAHRLMLTMEEIGAVVSDKGGCYCPGMVVEGEFVALTSPTIATITSLRSEMDEVRQHGYATDHREVILNNCCLGAPICDPVGGTIAAVSFADCADNLCKNWEEEVSGRLLSAGKSVSRKIFPVYEAVAH